MKYLPYSTFSEEYPIDRDALVGKGTYGKIYGVLRKIDDTQSHVGNMVVKEGTLEGLLTDVDVLATISHPNIILAEAFTIKNDEEILMVMPRGETIGECLKRTTILFEKIIYGILCGIHALHEADIIHGDIKPSNIVIIDDQPKIIDFSMSERMSTLSFEKDMEDGKTISVKGTSIYHVLNTDTFRAPEDIPDNFITEKTDIFALGKTVECLYMGVGYYRSNTPIEVENHILADFISLCLTPDHKDRPSAEALIMHPYFDTVREPIVRPVCSWDAIPLKPRNIGILKSMPPILYQWLVSICICYDISVRALFLAIHNIHRTLHIATRKSLQLLGMVNLDLACTQCGEKSIHVDTCLQLMKYGYTEAEYIDMRSKIVAILDGYIFCHTYWDDITYGEQIIPALIMTMQWNYYAVAKEYPDNSQMKYSKWQSCKILRDWHNRNKDRFRLMINEDPIDKYLDEPLVDPRPITYMLTAERLSLDSIISNIVCNITKSIGYVYMAKDRMEKDMQYANHILHTLMNTVEEYRFCIVGYDIIFGPKKLTLWDRDIKSLTINTYTSSYEDVCKALNI